MARRIKQTVDWFPHYCTHKMTMFILEQKYGNDGYAFWFKLLEMIGSTEGHYIDCNKVSTWEFLQAKTKATKEICTEILDTLSKLDAIDQELWDHKIIWSDNFIEGVAEAYRHRLEGAVPVKPTVDYVLNPDKSDKLRNVTEEMPLNTEASRINPQIRVDGIRIDKIREDNHKKEYDASVLLSEEQYDNLVEQFGETDVKERIKSLSLYKLSTGKKYKSDYHTILSWSRMDQKKMPSAIQKKQNESSRPAPQLTKVEDVIAKTQERK